MNPNVTQDLIIKKIRKFNKQLLLENLYFILKQIDLNNEKNHPIWQYFLLIKWTYLHGKNTGKRTYISRDKFGTLLKYMEMFENKTFAPLIKLNDWNTVFQIKTYQQFYLQQEVHWSDFARQLKLFGGSLKSKYDIEKSFCNKTNLPIFDFIFFMFLIWMFTLADVENNKNYQYNGSIENGILDMLKSIFKYENEPDHFINLLTLNEKNILHAINSYTTGLKKTEFQAFEMSFFTQYPFIFKGGRHDIVHRQIFNYSSHYYIYDYMKKHDDNFTEEFGSRFEKYVELGLQEAKLGYITENTLRNEIGKKEKVIDFLIDNQILVECKGIEPKPLPSIKPDAAIVFNALKDSILKAYLKQMLNVVKLKKELAKPLYGIIITYKDFYYSSLDDLSDILDFEIERICLENNWDKNPLPLENVFIINLTSWDMIIELIKEGNFTLINLLEDAVKTNKIQKTKWFYGFLQKYGNPQAKLSYLEEEHEILKKIIKDKNRFQN